MTTAFGSFGSTIFGSSAFLSWAEVGRLMANEAMMMTMAVNTRIDAPWFDFMLCNNLFDVQRVRPAGARRKRGDDDAVPAVLRGADDDAGVGEAAAIVVLGKLHALG